MSRHIIVTLDDAKIIARVLKASRLGPDSGAVVRIVQRFESEEGADLVDMVEVLKKVPICAACEGEGQAEYCSSLDAQKQGRRLRRLLDRAAGARP